MTTATDIEIDQRTRDELQPDCDIERCGHPVTHIARWEPCDCDAHTLLLSNSHAEYVARHRDCDVWECECGAKVKLLSLEPLR